MRSSKPGEGAEMTGRKLIALIMSICMITCMASLMTACGSGKKAAEPKEETAAAEETETEDASEASEEKRGSPQTMYVNAEDGLLLRKGPGTDNDVVHALTYGQDIQVEKTEDGWAYTTVDGKSGWCSMEYLTSNKDEIRTQEKSKSEDAAPDKLVEPSNSALDGYHGYVESPEGLNMRYGPGEQYDVIDVVPDKTELTELGWEEGWVYVQYKDNYGWISAQYFIMQGGREKPVIYLYPTRTTDVNVKVTLSGGRFTQCIPAGNGEWTVTARPDGRLTDKATGESYDYIFWESTDDTEYDWSKGYVVKGCEAEGFLLRVLPEMGLNEKEYTEFIGYWLPRLQKNEYNLVTFQTKCYTDTVRMDISPEPDSVLRVFMAFKKTDGPASVESPAIEPFERKGFTVVEWGGAEVR